MKKTGIYRIVIDRGEDPAKFYIGQAAKIGNRKSSHLGCLRRGTHKNQNLQRAFNKYGEPAFRFEVLLICSVENLTLYEQRIVDSYDRDELYNLCLECVDSVLGIKRAVKREGTFKGRSHTIESRALISSKKKGWKPEASHIEHLRRIAREKEPTSRHLIEKLAAMKLGTKKTAEEIAQRTATRRANAALRGRSY
jgi:group I intron endonuclease